MPSISTPQQHRVSHVRPHSQWDELCDRHDDYQLQRGDGAADAALAQWGLVRGAVLSGDTRHHIIIKGSPANTFIMDGSPFSCAAGQFLGHGGVGLYGPNHHIRLDGVLVTDTCGGGGIQTFHETALSGLPSHCNEFINGTVRRAGSKHPNGMDGAGSAFGHCYLYHHAW